MLLVFRSRGNPPFKSIFLQSRQLLVGRRWRHYFVRIAAKNTSDQFARVGFARLKGPHLNCHIALIKPQIGLSRRAIGSMTPEAILGKNWPNIAIVLRRFIGPER
jgi:hypothetical protein